MQKGRISTILLSIFFILISAISFASCEKATLLYEKIDGKEEYRVVGLDADKKADVVIPSTYEGLPVTEIGKNAFKECDELASVKIPDSVTTIGSNAFRSCRRLKSVEIPNSVTDIGSAVFAYSRNLTSVEIGDGVTAISDWMFYECSDLASVGVSDNITSIGVYAFRGCRSLKSIEIPDGVVNIGICAFTYCSKLASIEIPDSVEAIGEDAFSYCYRLVEVVNKSPYITVGKGLSSNGNIGKYALDVYNGDVFTSKLSNDNGYIVYTESYQKKVVNYMGEETELILPSYSTEIYQYAFFQSNTLTSVIIPDKVTEVGLFAFYGCTGLASVVIPDKVTKVEDGAFDACYELERVYYKGRAEKWVTINIGSENSYLTNAMRYYYSETEPTLNSDGTAYDGNYWYYDENGVPKVWEYNEN